ncbi:spermatogenesis-associated protein 7 homolog [Antennarius striatus]|uniref:spermatogenesis-associated protein 7 homolog n=1 Tax=Antennarius striatus TaxID=241820 RepID=UPI0035AF0176
MGSVYCNMESRIGSVSPGLRCSSTMRQQTWKRSSFYSSSSTKLTQSIIKDHMMSHYKKVYSAKAAIDASVPKSLTHSVKYNDQKRQEHIWKFGRPQSAHTFSQRNSRASCSSAQGQFYDDNHYFCSSSSTVSSPRLGTSFHPKDITKVSSQNRMHRSCPGSEIKYRSPGMTPLRKHSATSLSISRDESCYKTFEDPCQKTYKGDLLKKHSQKFTQEKPFTPKTLKSDKSSFLSTYRYYRAPRKKSSQVCPQSGMMHQETSDTNDKEDTHTIYDSSQGLNTEHEWSGDEFLESRQQCLANNSRDLPVNFCGSSSRVTPKGGKSTMKNITAEEEELMYLEFISAVTEDVASRQFISEKVIDRVIKRHIDMNRNWLDEGKMHHLLEELRKDFQEPANTFRADFERKDNTLLDAFLPHLKTGKRQMKTKENTGRSLDASLSEYYNSTGYAEPLFVSTPTPSLERTPSRTRINEREGENDNLGKVISSPWLGKHLLCDERISEDGSLQNQTGGNEGHEYASITNGKRFHQDQTEVSRDEQSKELEDLGRYLSAALEVSSGSVEATEEHSKAVPSNSDDEF